MRVFAAIILCLTLASCVDGQSGKFFIFGVTTTCK